MIKRIDSSYNIDTILDFCTTAVDDQRKGAANMNTVHWEDDPACLMHKIYVQKVFDDPQAGYLIKTVDDKIVAGQGFYPSHLDNQMGVFCARAYTIPNIYVHNAHGELSAHAIDLQKSFGLKGTYATFNEYNLPLMKKCHEVNDPKNWRNSYCDSEGKWWRSPIARIIPNKTSGPYDILYTKQWVLYHLFDETYEDFFLENLKIHAL